MTKNKHRIKKKDLDLRLYKDIAKQLSNYRLAISKISGKYPKEKLIFDNEWLSKLAKRLQIGVLIRFE